MVLCSNRIQPGFEDLVRILLISAPIIIPVDAFIFLFPVYGEPKYSTLVVFSANILNLIFNIILIKYLSMGCSICISYNNGSFYSFNYDFSYYKKE